MVAGITFGEGELRLSPRTAAKYLELKRRVFARTGRWTAITRPYGAGRTREQQAYLRNGYDRRLPGFYYAAKPDTVQANHQDRGDGGHAFDINNWEWVGEQVIKEEAAKLGLVRDPSERWHWNDNGVALAALNITPIEEDDLSYLNWSNADKDALFMDLFGGGRRMANWKGDMVAVADIIRATEQIAETGKNAAISASDAVTPGIPGVKFDGATYSMAKYTADLVKQVLGAQGEQAPAQDVDEEAIAASLLPSLIAAIQAQPAASIEAIAKATVAQLGKTITDKK